MADHVEPLTIKIHIMHLTPKEIDKLMLLSLGMIAERRMKKGLKLNYPEAVAYITSTALEGAREGKTVEEVMKGAASVLRKDDVMEGRRRHDRPAAGRSGLHRRLPSGEHPPSDQII